MSSKGVVLNGKFLTSAPTGVHRVAEELIKHVDILLAEGADALATPWRLVGPRDVKRELPLQKIDFVRAGFTTWQPWEQFELPVLARNDLIVSLCNLAPLLGRPGIAMIHDAQVFTSPESYGTAFRTWYQFALPKVGARSAKILTVSEFSRRQLAEYGIADYDRIEVVLNGVDHLHNVTPDPTILKTLDLSSTPYVVALANTQKHKNISILFEAFRRPELAGFKLVLVGRHGAEDFEADGLTPPPNTIFAGRVSDQEFRALLEAAVCLGFPSTTEGFGLPPLEAMLAGCPAVVAPCGALPEVCGDGALYADAQDAQAWAETIARLAADPNEHRQMRDLGLKQAGQFTWLRSAQRLVEIVQQVVG